ncbi:MAG: AraC family transcriptional regulator [Clostridia bacterium]
MENSHFHKFARTITVKSIYTFFKPKYNQDYYFSGEAHNFWEFVYVLDGKVGILANDKVYTLSKGQIIFHKPMEFHKLWAEDKTSPQLIIMSFTAKGEGLLVLENGVFYLNCDNELVLNALLNSIDEAYSPNYEYFLNLRNTANEISIQLVANNLERFLLSIIKTASINSTQKQSQIESNYQLIIRTISCHITEPLDINTIAVLCNMSTSNLKKTFHKYSKTSIMEYVNQQKIKESLILLKSGVPISKISNILSFSSQNYFSTVFKRQTGYAPSRYVFSK